MITAAHYIASGNFDLPIDAFPNADDETRYKYYTAHSKGIKWYTGDTVHTILEEGRDIHGIMTPDHQKMIIVYPYTHPDFNAPGNAVIYNADKSIYKILPLPLPVSDLSKNKGPYVNDSAYEGLYIAGVVCKKNENGISRMVLNLVFAREYCEERELNNETFEIGACLNAFML